MEDRWLSVDEVAEHLGIRRDTVYKWIERNGLPARKLGHLWKFRRKEVDEWVNRQPGTPRRRRAHHTGGTTEA